MEYEQEWYASVAFGADEAIEQRRFLEAMNSVGIIQVTKDQIMQWDIEDRQTRSGHENHLVLHGARERLQFENIMKTFFAYKSYQITDSSNNETFGEWLEKIKSKKQAHVMYKACAMAARAAYFQKENC